MYIFTSGIVLILCFLPATVSSLPLPFSLSEGVPFQNIVIFGDSLSDNGNVYALTNNTYPIPPYWNGRFSNGPNWVDQLGVLGVSDYAYGSATTDNNLVQGYTKGNTIPVPGMLQQVEIYLNNTNVNTIDFARTLYILWGGNNDFIFNQTLFPDVIVASLFKSAQALLDIGAKNILVFNQVPVQYFPFSQPYEAPELFNYLTDEGNFQISNLTESMQLDNPQASLNIFDIYSLILNIVTQNSTNFTNTVDNCWENINPTTVSQLCSDPEEYLFVDMLHFTSRAHALIADAIRPFLLDSNTESTTAITTIESTTTTTTFEATTTTTTIESITTTTTIEATTTTTAIESTTTTTTIGTTTTTTAIESTTTTTTIGTTTTTIGTTTTTTAIESTTTTTTIGTTTTTIGTTTTTTAIESTTTTTTIGTTTTTIGTTTTTIGTTTTTTAIESTTTTTTIGTTTTTIGTTTTTTAIESTTTTTTIGTTTTTIGTTTTTTAIESTTTTTTIGTTTTTIGTTTTTTAIESTTTTTTIGTTTTTIGTTTTTIGTTTTTTAIESTTTTTTIGTTTTTIGTTTTTTAIESTTTTTTIGTTTTTIGTTTTTTAIESTTTTTTIGTTTTTTYQVNSAVTFIPQLNSNDTLIFFFLLQLFHFFQ